jgi:hypothetical protein
MEARSCRASTLGVQRDQQLMAGRADACPMAYSRPEHSNTQAQEKLQPAKSKFTGVGFAASAH